MATCPVCDAAVDVDQDDVAEGDSLTCDECGADLRVAGLDPIELESLDDDEEDEDEDEDEEDEEDEDLDLEEDEDEEDEGENWK